MDMGTATSEVNCAGVVRRTKKGVMYSAYVMMTPVRRVNFRIVNMGSTGTTGCIPSVNKLSIICGSIRGLVRFRWVFWFFFGGLVGWWSTGVVLVGVRRSFL